MWIDHVGFHPWWQNPKYVFYFTIECCIKGTPSHDRCIRGQHCYFCFIVAAIGSSNYLNVWCRRGRWVNRKITENRYLVFQRLGSPKDKEILFMIKIITIYISKFQATHPNDDVRNLLLPDILRLVYLEYSFHLLFYSKISVTQTRPHGYKNDHYYNQNSGHRCCNATHRKTLF